MTTHSTRKRLLLPRLASRARSRFNALTGRGSQELWREDVPMTTSPLRFLAFASRPHWRAMAGALALVVAAAALQNSIPLLMRQIVDAATHLHNGSSGALLGAALGYLGASLGAELLWRGSGFIGNRWAFGARTTARYALSSYVTLHSRSYFADRFAGSVANKISHASNSMRDIIGQILWELLPFAVAVVVSFFVMSSVSLTLAFVFLGWIAVTAPMNIFFSRKRVALSSIAQKVETTLHGSTVDLISNVGTMQEYVRRPFELRRLQDLILRRQDAGLRNMDFGEWILTANSIIQACFVAAMLVFAVSEAQTGLLTAGDFVLIVSTVFSVQGRLLFLGQTIELFGERVGEIQESLEETIEPLQITDHGEAQALEVTSGAIVFDNVSFGYAAERGVLQGLSLYIPGKQKVGLVGKSGAGKSTLVKLMLRHYELTGGSISIDGHNISEITRDSLRQTVAVVPQEPLLFNRSIFENIAYGRPEATKDEVIRAAKLAYADHFIARLPEGYETLVGERGLKLSGGERQRVAIARAILKNAPILILDEATAALDSESEYLIQKALQTLMQGKTVIAIAHRLSTLREMDRIIVLDNGTIFEEGTHEGLMKGGGIYAELWQHQAGGFMVEA